MVEVFKGTAPKTYTTPKDPEVMFIKSRLDPSLIQIFCFIKVLTITTM